MAIQHGQKGVFTLNSVDLPHTTSVSLNFDQPAADATAMEDEWQVFTTGIPGATIDVAGWFDPAAANNDATIFAQLSAETEVTFAWGPFGDQSTDVKYSGNCFISSYSPSAEVASTVVYALTLQVTGPITRGAYS